MDPLLIAVASSIPRYMRAGSEDTAYYRPSEPAANNAQLVVRLVRIAEELGREVATPTQVRQMLQLADLSRTQ